MSKPALRPIQRPTQCVSGLFPPGLKRLGCEATHSFPCSAEEKNEWSYTYTRHTFSCRRQKQLNFNFCFFRFSAVLFHFPSVLFHFGNLLLHIRFHSFYEHLSLLPIFTAFAAANCTSPCLASYICLSSTSCLPFLMHLNGFFHRPNSLFAGRWQHFLPKRWYPCARIHAITFESITVFTVAKLRASNFCYQLSIERTVSVKHLNLLLHYQYQHMHNFSVIG